MNVIFNSALFLLCVFVKAAEYSPLQLIIPSNVPDYFRNHSSIHFTNYQSNSLAFELTDGGSYTEFKYFFDGKSVPARFTSEVHRSIPKLAVAFLKEREGSIKIISLDELEQWGVVHIQYYPFMQSFFDRFV